MTENSSSPSHNLAESALLRGAADDLLADFDRAYYIFQSLVDSCRQLYDIGLAVTVFGSARLQEGHRYYNLARELGSCLAKSGYAVMTGGGPGIMEAANRGAKEAGGLSIGCNIILPHEQGANPYLDRSLDFDYFFVRKIMLRKYSSAFFLMPGGLGSLDEIFETATLIQTGKLQRFPIVLMGSDYWTPITQAIREVMLGEGTLTEGEIDTFLTDSPEEAVAYIDRLIRTKNKE